MADKKMTPENQLSPFPHTVDRDGSFGNSRRRKSEPPPPPAEHHIQIRDTIFKEPPLENTEMYEVLSRQKKPRRRGCRVCLCAKFGVLLFLIASTAIAAAVLCLVFRPKAPDFLVTDLSVRGMNLTSSLVTLPGFDVTVRADNSENEIGIVYRSGGDVQVLYGGVPLAKGTMPVFYQPAKNVTVFQTALSGSSIVFADSVRLAMENEEKNARVPFRFKIKAPVKIRAGSVKSWKIIVKVKCEVAVDGLSEKAKVVSQHCEARFW